MAIIFCGSDRTGKSSLARATQELLRSMFNLNVPIAHCGKDTLNWTNMDQVVRFVRDNVLVDRCFDSEIVYSHCVRGREIPAALQEAWRRATDRDLIVHVRATPEQIRQRYALTANEDHYIDAEKAIEIDSAYRVHFWKSMAGTGPSRFMTIDSGEEEIHKQAADVIMTYARLRSLPFKID